MTRFSPLCVYFMIQISHCSRTYLLHYFCIVFALLSLHALMRAVSYSRPKLRNGKSKTFFYDQEPMWYANNYRPTLAQVITLKQAPSSQPGQLLSPPLHPFTHQIHPSLPPSLPSPMHFIPHSLAYSLPASLPPQVATGVRGHGQLIRRINKARRLHPDPPASMLCQTG